ncbi:GGDEF domain-containing protein [Polynucleobacter sp. CS-Odin-A6]|uniref:GGDEF domain-containing protein n=1 Tax=Polynucleobacter sp. CS-Odin-A6 TaxID=2689106 RepID=UPI001C0B750A|nr:GGDEF domain-containing protein [Polynucleobacter sp. CS-Odin-A6]MBU3621907.1 GGDEF domain-containing protein [Polynucleobacter sp. CS-Odin-A6]
MATSVSDLIVTRDYGALEAMLRHSFANEAIQAITITDLNGHVLVSLLRKSDDSVVLDFESQQLVTPQSTTSEQIENVNQGLISAWQKIDPGVSLGWLYIKVSTKFSDEILNHMKHNMIIFVILLFLMALGIAFYPIYFEVKKMNAREQALILSNDELSDAAHHDPLTGLPNRLALERLMANSMESASAESELLAICFLDLDEFKYVNDQFGHKVGDLTLQCVSDRLRNIIRVKDSVIRLGGDEFLLLLGGFQTRAQVEALLTRMIITLQGPVRIGGSQVSVGASIGVTLFPFDDGEVSSLLEHADQAMYQAKLDGKNCWKFYQSTQTPNILSGSAECS